MITSLDKTIYYDDTDAGGVVYHANYLRYMDHARSEFVSQLGFDFHTLQDTRNMSYVVVNVDINYRRPCRLGDKITVTAEIQKLGNTSMQFYQTVMLNNELSVDASVTVVIVNLATMKPTRIPQAIKEAFQDAK